MSIVVAALNRPLSTLVWLWPYVLLLASFAVFVAWNGGVVLGMYIWNNPIIIDYLANLVDMIIGDKSNHVPTLHFPQLFYLSASMVFFSLPILLPSILRKGLEVTAQLRSSMSSQNTLASIPSHHTAHQSRLVVKALLFIASLAAILGCIHVNTIIHPFTLADNRHYVFYVFRYTILRGKGFQYLLAPAYLFCLWTCFNVFCMSAADEDAEDESIVASTTATEKSVTHQQSKKGTVEKTSDQGSISNAPERNPLSTSSEQQSRPTVSWLIIYVVATSLSLISAPLVEPRYFILPWLMWRLSIPNTALDVTITTVYRSPASRSQVAVSPTSSWPRHLILSLETAWFLLINFITGYIFLHRGFTWDSEVGKVQRFMW